MPYYSQQDSFAYEIPTLDQTWQLFSGEELFIGEIESNTITNHVFDAEPIANWQMLDSNKDHSSGELSIGNVEFQFHAELTAHHWPVPMASHSMQAPSNEGFLSETPSTHQLLQRPFNTERPVNQIIYPALNQPLSYPLWEQRGAGNVGKQSAYNLHTITALPEAVLEPLPSGNTDTTTTPTPPLIAAPVHPLTGRYPCSYPTCAQDFGRSSDRVRHISSVHQRGQTNQGKNLCPIVGCRRSYGKGLCRPDKVNDHLKKVHGLVRVTPNGGAASAGPSAHSTGDGSNVAGGAATLAGNGN
ncbi:putative c2h2 transcription protein [Botrytis fragariae]|uniref:Putative c2h2 transcription protein n=1 Tax=Botrytis fragariae TaxID=1964551 RepID=A0A8H6END7_9HELO|nr:putative c2h2 transcription protein [Botrytis fragariae]KAF5878612.1 putative c2h2 transcription protein [Botrytis fragariae]